MQCVHTIYTNVYTYAPMCTCTHMCTVRMHFLFVFERCVSKWYCNVVREVHSSVVAAQQDTPVYSALYAAHPFLLETCPGELQHLPLVIEATFRRPLYIPSSVKVSFCWSGPALQLRVTNARDRSDLHVEATVQYY